MPKLAIHGGTPVRTKPFPSQNTIDDNEINAVIEIMKGGRLSGYRANWGKEFWGGAAIQKLEEEWKKKFNVKHAIPCNSATSGLQIACGAIGLGPFDDVIVTPYSMTCSATAPLVWNAIPIFADIEKNFYCLDPKSVEERITPETKAIIAVSLFGQPYDIRINEIARKHGLMIIEDAAQAIGSTINDLSAGIRMTEGPTSIESPMQFAGTLGDIGVYSFNYGKHITCGEGGMIVTNDDSLAIRCRLIMNHAEAVINDLEGTGSMGDHKTIEQLNSFDLKHNMLGFNMRMTELNAAIISEQLKKFDALLNQRRNNVHVLSNCLSKIPPITFSPTRPDCTHSYYVCSFQWDATLADGLHRNDFINAVKAELPPRIHRESEDIGVGSGYIKPLYLFPLFQNKKLYEDCGEYPFNMFKSGIHNDSYLKGSCPTCEDLWENKLFLTILHAPNSTPDDMKDVCDAFEKVWENRGELK